MQRMEMEMREDDDGGLKDLEARSLFVGVSYLLLPFLVYSFLCFRFWSHKFEAHLS